MPSAMVFDRTISGSMTNVLASTRAGRKCVSKVKNKNFFDESWGLLRKYLPHSLKRTNNMYIHSNTTAPKSVMKVVLDISEHCKIPNRTLIKILTYH